MRVDIKQFRFEHLDLFAWREYDEKTYDINDQLINALLGASAKGECGTAIYEGRILVIFGIMPITEKTGYCFTLFSRYADGHKLIAARTIRRMLFSAVESLGLHRVTTYNRTGADEHNKWCEWLGFKREGTVEKFDDKGNDYFQYAFIR
jgi:RimJ/RimL family protein N-acetyltransferase